MTKLETWRHASGFTADQIATDLGMRRASLYRIEKCQNWPRPETIVRIEAYTRNAVTASHLIADWVAARAAEAGVESSSEPGFQFEEALS